MKTDEELREEAKIIAKDLTEKMGIERISITTSVTPRPETTYYGWANGEYANRCALIAVNEILKLLPEYSNDYQVQQEYRRYTFVKEEIEIMVNKDLKVMEAYLKTFG